jgi:serine/threonine protein kinase
VDSHLGRYTVLAHLASGGMADVLLGRTDGIEGFQRHVVLKRIRTEHARDQRFIRMLLDEARLAANLHHHNIVQVHDVGEDAGEYFLAMEYLHGEDLRTILATASKKRQHVPLGHALAIVAAAAAGLHYAHERRDSDDRPLGIVHRDISPSNLLVSYDGSVKIVDFGIAKARAEASDDTHSGNLRGKISYMSPEQCRGDRGDRGDRVDRRSDVYALGVVLYELATTKRLFKGDSNFRMMEAIVNGNVVLPRVRRPDLPEELSAIIMCALAPDPERRYATADELRVALEQLARNLGLASSTSAIAAYMREQFGQRPEPWIHLGRLRQDAFDPDELSVARGSDPLNGADASHARSGSFPQHSGSFGPLRPGGLMASARGATFAERASERAAPESPLIASPPQAMPADEVVHLEVRPLQPSTPVARRSAATKALIAVPLLLIAGVVIGRLAGTGGDPPAVAVIAPAPPPVAPVPPPPPPVADPATATVHMPPISELAPVATAVAVVRPKKDKDRDKDRDKTKEKDTDAVTFDAGRPKRADAVAPKRPASAKSGDLAADAPSGPAAPAPATTTPVASPPSPPARTIESGPPPAAPAPAVSTRPPAPVAPPPSPALVALDANRIGGDKNIAPDDATQADIKRQGTARLTGVYKVCITASGDVSSVSPVRSTGFVAYDRKIQTTIRTQWRYRPFLVNGQPAPACTAVQLVYSES